MSIVAVLGLGPIACAGHHHISQAPPHPIAVEINNNLTVPTELTVFVTQDRGGSAHDAWYGAGRPDQVVHLYAVFVGYALPIGGPPSAGSHGDVAQVQVNDPETGVVSWIVIPNQVQFYDTATDTAAARAPGDRTRRQPVDVDVGLDEQTSGPGAAYTSPALRFVINHANAYCPCQVFAGNRHCPGVRRPSRSSRRTTGCHH